MLTNERVCEGERRERPTNTTSTSAITICLLPSNWLLDICMGECVCEREREKKREGEGEESATVLCIYTVYMYIYDSKCVYAFWQTYIMAHVHSGTRT